MSKCKPERNPRQAICMLISFIVLGLCCAYLITRSGEYKILAQLLFVAQLAMFAQLLYRYTMCVMVYTVGDGMFTAVRTIGRKQTVMCSVSLDDCTMLVAKSQYKKSAKRRINCNQNIRCSRSYILLTNHLAIEFEPNEIFVSIINQSLNK